jgi:hypothetical protein
MRRPDSAIALTHEVRGVPFCLHLETLRATNPETQVLVHVNHRQPVGLSEIERMTHYALLWRGNDRRLRECWKQRRDEAQGDVIALLEGDVLVNGPLPELPDRLDFAGANVIHTGSKWRWWSDVTLLPTGMRPVGVSPMAVILTRRKVLDFICEERWDDVFRTLAHCELRLPSVVAPRFRVGAIKLPGVHWKTPPADTSSPGVYHPVK